MAGVGSVNPSQRPVPSPRLESHVTLDHDLLRSINARTGVSENLSAEQASTFKRSASA